MHARTIEAAVNRLGMNQIQDGGGEKESPFVIMKPSERQRDIVN